MARFFCLALLGASLINFASMHRIKLNANDLLEDESYSDGSSLSNATECQGSWAAQCVDSKNKELHASEWETKGSKVVGKATACPAPRFAAQAFPMTKCCGNCGMLRGGTEIRWCCDKYQVNHHKSHTCLPGFQPPANWNGIKPALIPAGIIIPAGAGHCGGCEDAMNNCGKKGYTPGCLKVLPNQQANAKGEFKCGPCSECWHWPPLDGTR